MKALDDIAVIDESNALKYKDQISCKRTGIAFKL